MALRPGPEALGGSDGKTQNSAANGGIIRSKSFNPLAANGCGCQRQRLLKRAVDGLYGIAKTSADSCHFILLFSAPQLRAQDQFEAILLRFRFSRCSALKSHH
jgi:hypothetical protein